MSTAKKSRIQKFRGPALQKATMMQTKPVQRPTTKQAAAPTQFRRLMMSSQWPEKWLAMLRWQTWLYTAILDVDVQFEQDMDQMVAWALQDQTRQDQTVVALQTTAWKPQMVTYRTHQSCQQTRGAEEILWTLQQKQTAKQAPWTLLQRQKW